MKRDLNKEEQEIYHTGYKAGYDDHKKLVQNKIKDKGKILHKVTWQTSFMVFAYAAILFFCLVLQTVFLLGLKYGWSWASYVNPDFRLPIDNLTLIWTIICSAYIGIDRAAYCVRSAEMISGEGDVGNPATLRVVIVLTVGFFFLAMGCNIFVDADYDLVTLSTAVGTSMSLYITGQKALRICKNVNGKTISSEQEAAKTSESQMGK